MLEEKLQKELIQKGRDFMKGTMEDDAYEDFESDQDLKRPQPPLFKAAKTPLSTHIPLTRDFSGLNLKNDLVSLIRDRKSSRVYTEEEMSLAQLSFLLWATQGVRGMRGKSYAALRTVPSGGARHAFETYLAVRKVEGLESGIYHYLPAEHSLEFLKKMQEPEEEITDSLCGQKWAAKGNVIFYWTMEAYRAEWRYGIFAHRVALIDVGHVGQNLYLACTGLGLGTCAIAAFDHKTCCGLLDIDGEKEYVVYTAPVGTIRESDKANEDAFYQFVTEEGL